MSIAIYTALTIFDMTSAEPSSQSWSALYKTGTDFVSQPWKTWYNTGTQSQTADLSFWPMYVARNQVNGKIAPLGIDLGTPKPKPADL